MCCNPTKDFRRYIAGALRNVQEAQRAWVVASTLTSSVWAEALPWISCVLGELAVEMGEPAEIEVESLAT